MRQRLYSRYEQFIYYCRILNPYRILQQRNQLILVKKSLVHRIRKRQNKPDEGNNNNSNNNNNNNGSNNSNNNNNNSNSGNSSNQTNPSGSNNNGNTQRETKPSKQWFIEWRNKQCFVSSKYSNQSGIENPSSASSDFVVKSPN